MYDRNSAFRQYAVGYFARKHGLDRRSAEIILAKALSTRDANRLARASKSEPRGLENNINNVRQQLARSLAVR